VRDRGRSISIAQISPLPQYRGKHRVKSTHALPNGDLLPKVIYKHDVAPKLLLRRSLEL
jgi:hypothetical protein